LDASHFSHFEEQEVGYFLLYIYSSELIAGRWPRRDN
jgi:hypothetical protein